MKAVLGLILPLMIAYGGTAVWIWQSWMHEGSYYSYGPLVPLVAAFVIWIRRAEWRRLPARVDLRAWWLLGLGLVLHVIGAALMIDSFSAFSLALVVPAAAWLAYGWERFKVVASALCFVVLAIPLPMFVSGEIVFKLKEFVVTSAITIGNTLGLGIRRVGADILIPGQKPLFVADPCGGLNSLLSLVTLGYCVAFFFGPASMLRRVLLLLMAVPIAVLVNVLRVTGLCWLAKWRGTDWASTTGHTILNVAEWLMALVLLFCLDMLLSRGARLGKRDDGKRGERVTTENA